MTHSILMEVKIKEWQDVKEIKERILEYDGESYTCMFSLKKVPKSEYYPDVQPSGGMPPFITLPDNKKDIEDDGLYHIRVESGSHCAYHDTTESFFMWTFWYFFLKEIDSYGIEFTYGIGTDGEESKLNIKQALKIILEEDEELSKVIKVNLCNAKE